MWKKIDTVFSGFASRFGHASGQPLAFIIALATIVIWAVTGPAFNFSETWQLVINTATTIVTFLMVFLIQNSQNRDMASMQAKLDELLYALKGAREQFIGIEHLSAHEVDAIRDELEAEVVNHRGARVNASVARMIRRL